MEIHQKCPENYTTLIMRRFMMRLAERVARVQKAQALITGESVGQVASQTMDAVSYTHLDVYKRQEQYCGRKLSTLREIRDVALEIISHGVRIVAVSMGAGGALATDGVNTYYAPSAQVAVYSTVGAGDSMVAGLLKGFCDGGDLKEALRSGVAAASAAVNDPKGNLFPRALYEQFLTRVEVSRIQ